MDNGVSSRNVWYGNQPHRRGFNPRMTTRHWVQIKFIDHFIWFDKVESRWESQFNKNCQNYPKYDKRAVQHFQSVWDDAFDY